MKSAKLMLSVVSLLAGMTVAFAGEGAKKAQAAKPKQAKTEKTAVKKNTLGAQTQKRVALTGSYIKREVKRNGEITDGPEPVWVLDQKTIANSGAADLRQLLTRQGVAHY
jgi:outer membrane receptor for monomeric catechols